jgi:hypothetical protein
MEFGPSAVNAQSTRPEVAKLPPAARHLMGNGPEREAALLWSAQGADALAGSQWTDRMDGMYLIKPRVVYGFNPTTGRRNKYGVRGMVGQAVFLGQNGPPSGVCPLSRLCGKTAEGRMGSACWDTRCPEESEC